MTLKNAPSNGRASCPKEGLFDKRARRAWFGFRLGETVGFPAFMVVEVWGWLSSLRAMPSQRGC